MDILTDGETSDKIESKNGDIVDQKLKEANEYLATVDLHYFMRED